MASPSPYSGSVQMADIFGPRSDVHVDSMTYSHMIDPHTGDVRGHELMMSGEEETETRTYTSLETAVRCTAHAQNRSNNRLDDTFEINPDQYGEMTSWTFQQPDSWSTDQVLDWIYYMSNKLPNVLQGVQGENFNDLSGRQFCALTREEFRQRDPINGLTFYNLLQELLDNGQFIPPHVETTTSPCLPGIESVLQGNTCCKTENYNYNNHMVPYGGRFPYNRNKLTWAQQSVLPIPKSGMDPTLSSDYGPQVVPSVSDLNSTLDPDFDLFDPACTFPELNIDLIDGQTDCSDYSSEGYSSPSPPSSPLQDVVFENPVPLTTTPDFDTLRRQPPPNPTKKTGTGRPRGRPRTRRPPSESGSDGECPTTRKHNRGRKFGQTTKGNHLWEFVRDLLKNPHCNPQLLRWEDKSEGVFRFVKSEQVAKLWGIRKNNPQMTYEKLSRAMRFCRTTDYFSAVPKNGRYPKKLCFKFGRKATGWQQC